MGGEDTDVNLVNLTPEEHYVAHQLLIKIYPENKKLIKAAVMMIPNRPNNKMYGWLRRKFSETMSISQKGENNSQFDTVWITDDITEKKIKKNDPVSEPWYYGRLVSIKTREKRNLKKLRREQILAKKIENQRKKTLKKQEKIKRKIEELRPWYEIYKNYGFDGVKKNGYKYSLPNLVSQFAKYLPEFVSQNGVKRKKD
jgi:hypothetical protein